MTFDLKADRDLCEQCAYDDSVGADVLLPRLVAALDEIERQNAYIEQLSKQCQAFIHDEEMYGWIQDHHDLEMIVPCKLLDVAKKWHAAYRKAQNSNLVRKQLCEQKDERIAELEADLEYYKSGFHSERGVHERVTAVLGTHDAPWVLAQRAKERIAELVSENENLREWGISNASDAAREKVRTEKQLAALKKLGKAKRARGKALVEERAKRLVADRGDCPYRSPIKNQLISRCDKGIICDWCQCPIKDEWQDEAREQLRLEGKL